MTNKQLQTLCHRHEENNTKDKRGKDLYAACPAMAM